MIPVLVVPEKTCDIESKNFPGATTAILCTRILVANWVLWHLIFDMFGHHGVPMTHYMNVNMFDQG
jgi:hypothetical protein